MRIKLPRKSIKTGLTLLVLIVFVTSLTLILYKPKAHAQIFLTSGTTWTVPTDWVNTNNSIEAIGGGGGAGGGFQQSTGNGGYGGGGGGGGGYSKAVNVTLTPGATVSFSIGTAGTGGGSGANGTGGSDTYICSSISNCTSITDSAVIAGAKGGALGAAGTTGAAGAGGTGGAAASGVGSVKFNGGTGGTGGPFSSSTGGGGGGGAGAAGPNAAGNGGTTPTNDTHGNGGQGDGTSGGAGGSATSGANGSNGTEYDGSHGSGGGAAGGDGSKNGTGFAGGIGGAYGAGGGGGGGNGRAANPGGAGNNGNQGLIRITYSLATQVNYRWRSDDGNETTGTSLAAEGTVASVNYGNIVRLRMQVSNSGDTNSNVYRLEYAPYSNGCGSWTTLPAAATTEHFNMANTANYTDQTASTNVSSGPAVITDPSGYTFVAGKLVSNTSNSATVTLTSGQFTEIEYAIQPNSNATNPSYCFRVTNAGTPLDVYNTYPILNINYPPSTPTIYSVVDSTTNVPRLPIYQLKSTDLNNDYLKYVVEECPTNSFPCGGGGHTYDQTSSQTCWSIQDAQSATAFASSATLSSSTMAYCQTPITDILTPSTTYYWRARVIDPGGTNTYSAYSSVATFSTSILDIQINGGTSITGGTKIGN